MAAAASGDWLLGRHGVAAAARLAGSRRVGSAASRDAQAAQRPRAARLVDRGRRREPHPRSSRWSTDRPFSSRPSSHRFQVPPDRRPSRPAVGRNADRGHRNDVTQLLPLIDGIGAITGKRGRPRQRPDRVIADRGYDHDSYRRELWRRGVQPQIARRRTEHGSGLGRVRWVVERTFAWLHNFRRLRIRWERDAGLHYALLSLGCSLICWRHIRP